MTNKDIYKTSNAMIDAHQKFCDEQTEMDEPNSMCNKYGHCVVCAFKWLHKRVPQAKERY